MAPRLYIARPPQNPLLQLLYLIGAAVMIVAAFVMGAVILAVVIGFAMIVALVIWVRIWWLRRKFRGSAGPGGRPSGSGAGSESRVEITSVEYEVVDERDDGDTGR